MRWQRLGPGGGGAMYVPTVHPTDPETAVVTCDMTGTYLTHTGGQSWRQINFTGMVRAVSFDPFDPAVLYLGSSGLYCSKDNGEKWDLMYPPRAEVAREMTYGDHASHTFVTKDGVAVGFVEGVLAHPECRGVLWMGLSTSRLGNFYDQGALSLVVSTDGGKTWSHPLEVAGKKIVSLCPLQGDGALLFTDEQILKAENTASGIAITILQHAQTEFLDAAYGRHPETGAWVYYHTERPDAGDADARRARVYRSVKLENGWEALGEGLFADHAPGQGYVFSHVAVSLTDASRVYVSLSEPMTAAERVQGKESFFGLFCSEDFGGHFHWVLRIGDHQPENRSKGWVERDYSTGWGGAPFGLGVSASDPDVCYATDWGTCYRTTDGGQTWKQLYSTDSGTGRHTSTGLDVTLVYHLHFDPHEYRHLAIACTDIGLFDSEDDGMTWRHRVRGVPDAWRNSCYCLAFDPAVKNRAWSVWTNCHDLPRPKMFLNGGLARRRGGICRTDDGCDTWTVASAGLPECLAPTCILLDPESPVGSRTLYVTAMGDGVYRSRDDGATWQPCNSGIDGNLNAWKIFRDSEGALYVLVARGLVDGQEIDGALYRSQDGGESWQRMSLPEGVNAPNFLAIDPQNPRRLYLACWPRIVDGTEGFGGLYRTVDGGETWALLTSSASHVYGVAIDPRNPLHVCWSNFENQVWASWDGGDTAEALDGFDFKWAHQPIFHPEDPRRLYVATFGSSLWLGME